MWQIRPIEMQKLITKSKISWLEIILQVRNCRREKIQPILIAENDLESRRKSILIAVFVNHAVRGFLGQDEIQCAEKKR